MALLFNTTLLLTGFAVIIFSGNRLVESSIALALRWGIPASLIAATIIAGGTSAPEIITSLLAGSKGHFDISIGNLLGSNTFNLLAVGGLSLVLQPLGGLAGVFMPWSVLMAATGLLYIFFFDLRVSPFEAGLLLLSLVIFLGISLCGSKKEVDLSTKVPSTAHGSWTLLIFVVSLCGVLIGAELALAGGVALGQAMGLSSRVIAITLIAAGTGLPEMTTSMVAAYKGHGDIAIANLVGSNIINTFAITGFAGSLFSLEISSILIDIDFLVMAAASTSLGLIFVLNSSLGRRLLGTILFTAYCTYIALIL